MNHHQPTPFAAVALKTTGAAAAAIALTIVIICLANPSTSQPRPHVMDAVSAASVNSVDSTFLLTCGDNAVARPATFDVVCSQAIHTLVQLDWSSWGGTTAKAVGRYVSRHCTPTCAAGPDTSYPVTVVADHRVTRDGVSSYQELTVTYTGGPADLLGSSLTLEVTPDWPTTGTGS